MVVAAALFGAIVMVGAQAFAALNSSGTFSMSAGSSLRLRCPTALSNSNVGAKSETVNCDPNATDTTAPSTTTSSSDTPTTTPDTSTTTSSPPDTSATTTTTTATGPTTGYECTSDKSGVLGAYDYSGNTNSNGYNTYVENDMWAAQAGTTATICARHPGDWYVDTYAGTAQSDGGAVQTFPNTAQQFDDWCGNGVWNNCAPMSDTPLSALKSLTSSYTIQNPPDTVGDWQATYDIWLNNNGSNNEIMIWVHTSNERGTGGAQVITPHITIGGLDYHYQNYGGGLPQMVLNTNLDHGTIDVLGVLNWLKTQGVVGSAATLSLLQFGWEICHTDGRTLHFAMTAYSLTASA
jgi:hypothetical protein